MKPHIHLLSSALLLVLLVGCRRTPPTTYVVLPDISQSIERSAVVGEFQEIDGLIDRMQRGDSLTVLPITGNAMGELPGHVLRLTAPTQRQAYDHDLVVFRQQAHANFGSLRDLALAHPSKRTDILGTLDVARQEFQAATLGNRKQLIVLSDLLEDDELYHFSSDRALTEAYLAEVLGKHLQQERAFNLINVGVSLEVVQSTDLRAIKPQRQQAVRAFWKAYFAPTAGAEIKRVPDALTRLLAGLYFD